MTREREEAIKHIENIIPYVGKNLKESLNMAVKVLKQESILDEIRLEIEIKIKRKEYARSVFCYEEKDAVKEEQCTGSIMAYNDMIKLIDEYKAKAENIEI